MIWGLVGLLPVENHLHANQDGHRKLKLWKELSPWVKQPNIAKLDYDGKYPYFNEVGQPPNAWAVVAIGRVQLRNEHFAPHWLCQCLKLTGINVGKVSDLKQHEVQKTIDLGSNLSLFQVLQSDSSPLDYIKQIMCPDDCQSKSILQ